MGDLQLAKDELIAILRLQNVKNIGDVTAKKLLAYCGNARQVFNEKKRALEKVPGIGSVNAQRIIDHKKEALEIAERELQYIESNNIKLGLVSMCGNL